MSIVQLCLPFGSRPFGANKTCCTTELRTSKKNEGGLTRVSSVVLNKIGLRINFFPASFHAWAAFLLSFSRLP